ncbi:MT-A70 family methyltransferase [Paracoccus alkanivorans]|uniref:DNA methyltransferase n=1 Tax=Paracoccus alkanivorans TaxID=2116655 RepID=A0A3M0M7H7_9RHOB|nr:MT-A70 family methyltransferase [Paracoccus alkanivorans]RMC33742.1 DNA methyltransferase [Paracoccus alkanivorans]
MNLPIGPFDVILADPPWRFASNSDAKPGRNARRHYDCMSLDEICALPVKDSAAKNALLLMWVTVPFAHMADQVVRAWGFRAKSQLIWCKQRIGTGYWVRNKHEICVLATRGRFPCPSPALFPTSIIPGEQRGHSRKPEWVQDVIDERLPDSRKLEMFARRPRGGWTVWGNEVEKFQEVGNACPSI